MTHHSPDGVYADPELAALYDEVTDLAKRDARAGIDLRTLEGELIAAQWLYDEVFTSEACAMAAEREAN